MRPGRVRTIMFPVVAAAALCGVFAACSGAKYYSPLHEQGEDLLRARQYGPAVQAFQEALRDAGARKDARELSTLHGMLGWTYAESMRFDDAERETREAIRIAEEGNVDASLLYARLAVVDSKAGNYADGIAAADRSLTLLAAAWKSRARMQERDRIVDFAVANHGYPPDVVMLKTVTMAESSLAVMLFLTGENERAIETGERAFRHFDGLSTLMMLAPSGEKVEFFRGKAISAAVTSRAHRNLGHAEQERSFARAAADAFGRIGVKVQNDDFLAAYAASGGYLAGAKTAGGTFRPDPRYSDAFNAAEKLAYDGRSRDSVAAYRAVIDAARTAGKRDEASRALSQLGWLLAEMGRYPEAVRLLQESVALSPQSDLSAVTFARIASVLARLGNYEKGLAAADQAFALVYENRRQLFQGRDRDAVIDQAMKNPGLPPDILMIKSVTAAEGARVTILYLGGRYGEAVREGERALRHFADVSSAIALAPEREQVSAFEGLGFIELMVGDSLLHLGEIKKGRDHITRSRESFRKARLVYGDVIAEGLIAYSHVLEGDFRTGAEVLKRNLSRAEQAGMDELLWRIRSTFAGFLREEARAVERARSRMVSLEGWPAVRSMKQETAARNRSKVEVLKVLLGADRSDRLVRSVDVLDASETREAVQDGLAALAKSLKEEAYRNYLGALESTEQIRSVLETDLNKRLFQANKQELYDALVVLASELYGAEQGFEMLERTKARGLTDLLASREIAYREPLFAQEGARLRESAAEKRLAARFRDRAPAEAERPAASIDEEISGYRGLVIRIKKEDPELASLVTASFVRIGDVRKMLPDNVVLIEYFISHDGVLIWVVDRTGVFLVSSLIEKEALGVKVREFREAIGVQSREREQMLSRELYGLLITPVRDKINGRHVLIVPHDVLHYLPFNALSSEGRYLIEEHALSEAPSASVLQYVLRKQRQRTKRILALGNPDLDDHLLDLPAAQAEVEAIKRIYPDTEIYIRKEATESMVRERAADFDTLHFASHAEFNTVDPLSSGIRLAAGGGNDGRLEAAEVFSLRVTSPLVVLSACRTGLGAITTGDEIIGMNRAFLYAGAPSVVASLWSVSDESTARLMESFYRNLGTMPKAEALRQAQVSLIHSREYGMPFFWAPFYLTGEWRQ